MWPLLRPGSRVRILATQATVGSVAVYRRRGSCFAHRVVGAYSTGVYVRGDRPGSPLERVEQQDIVGRLDLRGPLGPFMRPPLGKLIGRASLALSGPSVALLRRIKRSLPSEPAWRPVVTVFKGSLDELGRDLARAGHGLRISALEELSELFGGDDLGGFVVVARSLGRSLGAVSVREATGLVCRREPSGRRAGTDAIGERPGGASREGLVTCSIRRVRGRDAILEDMLRVAAHEAKRRGFDCLHAQATTGGRSDPSGDVGVALDPVALRALGDAEAAALLNVGFRCVEPCARRVPSTGKRIAAFRSSL